LDNLILPRLGKIRLSQIGIETVSAWRSDLIIEGLAPTTTRNAYVLLRQVLEAAVDAQRIASNPCRVKGAAQVPVTNRQPPTIKQAKALMDAMPDELRALVLLAGFVGLRLGECQALRRRHVDMAARTLRVELAVTEVDGGLEEGPPKTSAAVRWVDLPNAVLAELELHLDRFTQPGPDGLMFSGATGRHLRRRRIYAAWARARAEVGLPDVRIHDLRHLAGRLGTLTGATTREQMQRLGHASPVAALRYQHVVEGRGRAVADGIDRMLGGVD
jgi:integrase